MGPWARIGTGRFVVAPSLASPINVGFYCDRKVLLAAASGSLGSFQHQPQTSVLGRQLTALTYRTQLECTDVTTSGSHFLVVGGRGGASLRRWRDPNMRRRNTVRDGRRAGGFHGPDDDMRGTRVGLAGLIWLFVMGGWGCNHRDSA